MKKRFLFPLALALLCLLPAALALTAEGDHIVMPEEGVKVYLKNSAEWTLVTPDNLDEHIDLILSRGESEDNARMRYARGSVLFEAFHERYPDGRIRLEAFEDAQTRNVWHLDDLTPGRIDALCESLRENLFCGRYHLLRVDPDRGAKTGRDITGSMIAYPPYQYESGMYALCYYNGKAYMYSYVQSTRASRAGYLSSPSIWEDMRQRTALGQKGRFGGWGFSVLGERLSPVADLDIDAERLILNAHSGAFTLTGKTEKLASVVVSLDGVDTPAKVDDQGKITCDVSLTSGENEAVMTADKKNARRNTLTVVIPVDDTKAALELYEFPYGHVDRAKMTVSGAVTPGASVTLQIDGGDFIRVSVDEKGKFKEKLTAADWEEHTLTITASEDGLADCVAEYAFVPQYEDAQKGIYAFNKARDKEIDRFDIVGDPAAHVGKKVLLIAKVEEISYDNGYMTMLAQIEVGSIAHGTTYTGGGIYFVADSYLDDVVGVGSVVNVYGTIIEPSMTEPPLPRVAVQYISYYQ